MTDTLVVIPARGGSKGIAGKNIKPLGGVALIDYTLNIALKLFPASHIILTTDDREIAERGKALGVPPPFMRPAELATDTASTNDVLVHAHQFCQDQGMSYDKILLLQPTSPFRKLDHIQEALAVYSSDIDMVVSASVSKANPYYNLFEEGGDGLLAKSKPGTYTRRQDCPEVYELNGSIYVINPNSLVSKGLSGFTHIKKYLMPVLFSIDLDTDMDWHMAEYMLANNLVPTDG